MAGAPPPIGRVRPRLMSHAERLATYGVPARFDAKTGTLVPDREWERRNLVTVLVPWPVKTAKYGHEQPLRVHRKAAAKFVELFGRWDNAGLLPLIKTYDGTHVTRMKRGQEKALDTSKLSTHAFGAAIDLNARWNGFNARPAARALPGSLVDLVPIALEVGFVWGGSWTIQDGMHFELSADALLG